MAEPKTKKSKPSIVENITDEQWETFYRNGYVKLGKTLTDEEIEQLKERSEEIMLGKVQYGDKLLMQLDPGGNYGEHVYNGQTPGFKGPTLKYRKLGETGCGLECDPLFRKVMSKPIFQQACQRIYGSHAGIGVYRAVLFNKPSGAGTDLPWHQDGGEWWGLDRDPQIFVWTAIDPATEENGCVHVIRGSYKLGILTQQGHMLTEEDVKKYCVPENEDLLVCDAGESILVHNWTIHKSGTNPTPGSRRGLSVNYIDSRTKVLDPKPELAGELGRPGQSFHVLFESPFHTKA